MLSPAYILTGMEPLWNPLFCLQKNHNISQFGRQNNLGQHTCLHLDSYANIGSILMVGFSSFSFLLMSSFSLLISSLLCFNLSFSSEISYRILFLADMMLFRVFSFFSSTKIQNIFCFVFLNQVSVHTDSPQVTDKFHSYVCLSVSQNSYLWFVSSVS